MIQEIKTKDSVPSHVNLGGTYEANLVRTVMQHLARFYEFEGLFRWKGKFNPSFEDRYLVYADPLALPQIALSLARAQSAGGLRAYLRRGSRTSVARQAAVVS